MGFLQKETKLIRLEYMFFKGGGYDENKEVITNKQWLAK